MAVDRVHKLRLQKSASKHVEGWYVENMPVLIRAVHHTPTLAHMILPAPSTPGPCQTLTALIYGRCANFILRGNAFKT